MARSTLLACSCPTSNVINTTRTRHAITLRLNFNIRMRLIQHVQYSRFSIHPSLCNYLHRRNPIHMSMIHTYNCELLSSFYFLLLGSTSNESRNLTRLTVKNVLCRSLPMTGYLATPKNAKCLNPTIRAKRFNDTHAPSSALHPDPE